MPFREARACWADIQESIRLIESFLMHHDFETYRTNLMMKSAVERQMPVISEAAIRLGSEAEDACPGLDWRGLRGMGNILRHAYHRIDDRIVWDTAKEDLPLLKACVEAVLDAPEAGSNHETQ